MNNLNDLEEKLKIKFKNKDLLLEAMTHRSYLNENPDWKVPHNERMEFLGDAVLELVVTEYLFNNYSNPEGELTNWRAALVNATILAKISYKIDLNNYVLLSRGEAKDEGRARQFILANTMEALIGAIYLDGGYDEAGKFIHKYILDELDEIIKLKLYKDHKSLLQELSQDDLGLTPTYEVLEESGPDHDKHFKIGVYLGKDLVGEGEGPNKQEAQQKAASQALEKHPVLREKVNLTNE